jgi:hypothetical protein
MRLRDHGQFATWSYPAPDGRSSHRDQWRGSAAMTTKWAFAMRSPCGTFFEICDGKSGYTSEAEAVEAAQSKLYA